MAISLPEEGEGYWTGFLNVIRLSGEETGGDFSVVEERLGPGDGSPLHIHHNEDQTDYILEGELEYIVGDKTIRATPGTIVHGPKGIPHAFRNVRDEPAILFSWFHPAGFEELIAKVGDSAEKYPEAPPEPDMEKMMALAQEYGLEIIPSEKQ